MSGYAPLQILIPAYNDWESVRQLLPLIDQQLEHAAVPADVMLVDDGSCTPDGGGWETLGHGLRKVRILRLYRNLGHQRAICVALCHLREHTACQQVLVMDGDGEDSPGDLLKLLEALRTQPATRIVFAERARRSEGTVFKMFYTLYRWLHLVLVGQRVRVGNFSVMRRECLESLCTSPELWNHFAAAVFATRQSMAFVPTQRARRLAGRSKMNFPSLVMHGLSALSVFADRISTRLLIATAALGVVTALAMVALAVAGLTAEGRIASLLSFACGLLIVLLVQTATFLLTFCFLILFTRAQSPFIPIRDYGHFVRSIDEGTHAPS